MDDAHRMLQQLVQAAAERRAPARWPGGADTSVSAEAEGGQLLLTLALDGRGSPSARELLTRRGRELPRYAHWLPARLADGTLVLVTRLPLQDDGQLAGVPSAYEIEAARRLLG